MLHNAIFDNTTAPGLVGQDLASRMDIENYFTIGATAVLLWDIILHLPEDYQQIRKQGFLKLSRIVYCFSRFSTLFYMVTLCVVKTAPIRNCAWVRYSAYMAPFGIPVTLLLFLFRIYALFRNRCYILVFVFLSWILVIGSSIAVAVRAEGVNINGTEFCMKKNQEKDVAGALCTIIRFSHDTLVFTMTSWWLYRSNLTNNCRLKTIVFGQHLLPLTRSLLHDGQAYYLATLILNVFAIAIYFVNEPFVMPCTLGTILTVLIHNMACHVYRNLVSAKYTDHCEFLQWVDGEWQEDITEVESLGTRPVADRSSV